MGPAADEIVVVDQADRYPDGAKDELLAETKAGFEAEFEMPCSFVEVFGSVDFEPDRRLAGIALPMKLTAYWVAGALLRLVEGNEKRSETPFELVGNFLGLLVGNLKLYVGRKPYPSERL
jgi:hypothetical protein